MGIYYRYVNFTLGEFVSLSDLRDGGDKDNAVVYCAPALAHLLAQPRLGGDGYRGRWRQHDPTARAHDVRIVSDASYDFYDMNEGGTAEMPEGFLNITPGLLQSLRAEWPGITEDYKPRHDVVIVTHEVTNGLYKPLDAVHAFCKCGWQAGPIFGENGEETLTRMVSNHVSPTHVTRSRSPRPWVHHVELSGDEVAEMVDLIERVLPEPGVTPVIQMNAEECVILTRLRDRIANTKGTR